ncbi:metallophosphoesterase family protein [Lactobacillus isalae]|uniref:metallophosphoesterase family protein n=1 Tax=Lactobacillus isalae TaxID=2993455 RepID=UPI0024A8FAE9|nr:metallophosphoesterase [Lactobacillus isalae]
MTMTSVNNGEPYYLKVDISKAGESAVSINNYIKMRVFDNGKILPVKWFDQNVVMNVNGMIPFIEGSVGQWSTDDNDNIVMAPDAVHRDWQGSAANTRDGGWADYILTDQMFTEEGIFYGFIGLMDGNGRRLTSINIWFRVLGDNLIFGLTQKYYSNKIEKFIRQMQAKGDQAVADLYEKYKNKAQKSEDTLDSIQKNLDTIDASFKSAATSAKAIQDRIDSEDIVTNARFDDVTKGLTKNITAKLSEISSTIPWLKNSEAIEEKYPNGYSGAVIAADTMHKWLYYDGRWNDAGLYTESITKDGDIVAYLDEGKVLNWDPNSSDCKLDLSDMTTGITIRGAVDISFTKEEIYKTFNSSPETKLNGDIVTGKSFALIFYFSTNKLGIINPSDDLITQDAKILFLHHYTSTNDGLLVSSQFYLQQLRELQVNAANMPFAYVAENKDLSYDYWDNECNLKFDGDWVEVYFNHWKWDVKVSDILVAAKESKVVKVTDNDIIKGNTFIMYFDGNDKKVKFTNKEDGVPTGGFTLFAHEYNSYTGGPLVDYHVHKQAQEFIRKYEKGEQENNKVPAYFKDNLTQGIDRVNQNMGEAGPNSMSFLFITDMHWGGNAKHSPALVHELMKKTGLPLMVNGGDFFDQGEKAEMRNEVTTAIGSVKYPGTFMATVRGNHDGNWNNWGGQHDHPDWKFSYNDIYGYEFAYMMRDKNLVNDFHYLNIGNDFTYTFTEIDGSGQVWRFICIDTLDLDGGTNINLDSFKKICDLLKESKNEKIIFVAHIFSNNHDHTDFEKDLEKVIDARNSQGTATVSWGTVDFSQSENTTKVIACFGGHEHEDYDWTTPSGVPFILTDSDNAPRTETTKYGHDYGTIGEQCFDVVTINPSAKKIKAVRIGRGIDRSWDLR